MSNRTPDLTKIPLFGALSVPEQQYFASKFTRQDYLRGDTIIESGIRGGFLAVVSSGLVALQAPPAKTRKIAPGGSFGESMLTDNAPSPEAAVAVRNSSLWVLDRDVWLAGPAQVSNEKVASRLRVTHPRRWRRLVLVLLVVAIILTLLSPALIEFVSTTLPAWAAESGRPDLAIAYLNVLNRQFPESDALLASIGYAQMFSGNKTAALQSFQQALALNPGSAYAQNSVGVLLLSSGDPSAALPYLLEATRIDPARPEAFTNLGNAYLALGERTAAASAYRRVFELDPGRYESRSLWAALAFEQGRIGQARQAWEVIVKAHPGYAPANQGLGVIAYQEGRPVEALTFLDAARRSDPADPITRYYLGLVLTGLGRTDEAAAQFAAVSVLSDDPDLVSQANHQLKGLP